MLSKVKERVSKKSKPERNIALYIDGPNLLRKEFKLDLDKLRKKLEKYGRIIIAKVFLNQFASEKLIEAVASQGFEPVIEMGGEKNEQKSDVDASMGATIMEGVFNPNVDVVAIATRDADFMPVVLKVKEYGKKVIVIGTNPGFSVALRNAADYVEEL
ncbi:MAG: TIGR00288 family NYN domain-containing protein [Candidatus Aenigmarchaeota archaeon]|nr:TIGR00288 family NYN domain-containing protein [Candidatus Aenigmarchaeota archaeon]